MENTNQSNSNTNSSYNDLGLQELKDLAKQREIIPEGNKSSKDTWKNALAEDDRLKAFAANNGNSQNSPSVNGQEQNDNYQYSSPENPSTESFIDKQSNVSAPLASDVQQNSDSLIAENSSIEARNYVLDNIVTPLDQRRVDVDRLQVNLDGQNIFQMRDGNVANSSITDSQAELIKQALNDPTSFEGTVKITNGKQTLLHVENGQVVRDALNLTKTTTKLEISSSSDSLYRKYSQGVEKDNSLKATKQIAKNALSGGVNQQQVKDMIKSQDPAYKSLASSAGQDLASNNLDKIVTIAAAEVKNANSQSNSETLQKSPALSRR